MLLRSVVVNDSRRGTGIGSAVVPEIERRAASQGANRIHLLSQGVFSAEWICSV